MPYRRTPTKWTTESFVKRIGEISPSLCVLGEYTKYSDSIKCHCSICGNTWFPNTGNLLKGCGCPECAKRNQSSRPKNNKKTRQKWTQSSVIEKVHENDPNIEVIGPYLNTSSNIECHCKQCGEVWFPTANNLIQGKSHCPKCSRSNATKQTSMTHDEFIKRVIDNNPDVEILGQYTTTKARILCKCKTCGNEWMPTADSLLSGRRCRKCAYSDYKEKMRFSQEEFTDKLKTVNESIIALDKYSGAYGPMHFKCLVCGNEWISKPHYILLGNGCPECDHSSTSYVEQFLLIALKVTLGENEVFSRDKTAIGKELDIYLPNYSIAIEPGSWGFHKGKRKSDENKAKLCEKHQIKLITIYTGYKDKAINSPNVFCYAQNLSRKSERKELIGLFYRILEYTGVSIQFDENKWDEISNIAYINSRRTTTDTFKEKLSAVNPTISVLGEYKSSKEKVLCRCDICGYEWNVTPGDLLSGRGCPLCAKKRRGELRKYSQETFVTLVSERNPNIEILGSYSGSKDQIACKCKLCGYVWAPPAGSLISARKRGCPNCSRVVKQNAKASQKL